MFALGAALMSGTLEMHAAVRTWTGGGANGFWTTTANWSSNTPPVAGDSIIFPAGAPRLLNTNNFATNTLFTSILFGPGASNYLVYGNGIRLAASLESETATNTFAPDIQLTADVFVGALGAGATLILNGDVLRAISLNGHNLSVGGPGETRIFGYLTNAGNLIINGPGKTRLSSIGINTYVGTTTVKDGTLELYTGLFGPLTAIPGPLIVGDGLGSANSAAVRWLVENQIADTSSVTVNADGLLDLNGFSDAIGSLSLNGGSITTGSGMLTLGGNVSATSTNIAQVSGLLSLGGVTRTFDVSIGPTAPGVFISASIIDGGAAAGLTKDGSGQLWLSGSNSYSGVTTINGGSIAIQNSFALGSTNAGTLIGPNASLIMEGNVHVGEEPLTLNGPGALPAQLVSILGNNSWAGHIVLNADAVFRSFNGSALTLSGGISGPSSLLLDGGGTNVFSGSAANTYSGITTVTNGTLLLAKAGASALAGPLIIGDDVSFLGHAVVRWLASNQLPDFMPVTINSSGLADLNNFSEIMGPLTMHGGRLLTGNGLLTLNGNVFASGSTNNLGQETALIAGRLSVSNFMRHFEVSAIGAVVPHLDIVASISGAGGGIVKEGAGTLLLASSNSYTFFTIVEEGELEADNDFALGSPGGGTIVHSNATLRLGSGWNAGGEPLTLNGNGFNGSGALAFFSATTNSWTGPIQLNSDSTINVASASAKLILNSTISSVGQLTKNGSGTLSLSGPDANTFSGGTFVKAGTLELAKPSTITALPGVSLIIGDGIGGANADVVRLAAGQQIADTVDVTVNSSGLLDLPGFVESIGSLAGAGHVNIGGGLFTGGSGLSTSFSGSISGSGEFRKEGGGRFTLLGTNNPYTGPTWVRQGQLEEDGMLTGSSIIRVGSGAELGGLRPGRPCHPGGRSSPRSRSITGG